MMEPWDGPALIAFTDGRVIGGTLDRNGLRPARWLVTDDDLVVLASEAGALEIDPARILEKGRIHPGSMFLVDTRAGRVMHDEEIKRDLASRKPYRAWVAANRVGLDELPEPLGVPHVEHEDLARRQAAFGYTAEELSMILTPMATTGEEPVGSMGNDTPLAVLSHEPQLLFNYFKQLFAQVTNPPIDPIREQLVMSLSVNIGPRTERPWRAARACAARSREESDPHERRAREDPRDGQGGPALQVQDAAHAVSLRRVARGRFTSRSRRCVARRRRLCTKGIR